MNVKGDIHEVLDCDADATFLHASDVGSSDETREERILGKTLESLVRDTFSIQFRIDMDIILTRPPSGFYGNVRIPWQA